MNSKNFRLALILLAVMPILFIGCNRSQTPAEPVYDTIPLEPEPEPEPEVVIEEPAPKPAPAPRQAVRKEPQKEEVLYISGHGANGRVWGHITMKGNKGRGSVTDEHENALTVTCTRQGEELICYDQNSRQYIFRL
ncbi:MAG: hypothetical protein IKN11_06920 [Bacteroidales bacterium]|nr:hypothetical protein [Bacteroidales bacterium]